MHYLLELRAQIITGFVHWTETKIWNSWIIGQITHLQLVWIGTFTWVTIVLSCSMCIWAFLWSAFHTAAVCWAVGELSGILKHTVFLWKTAIILSMLEFLPWFLTTLTHWTQERARGGLISCLSLLLLGSLWSPFLDIFQLSGNVWTQKKKASLLQGRTNQKKLVRNSNKLLL